MSLLLLFAGVGKRDRHDGVWDEDTYRKYQERLRRQREKLAQQEQADEKRKLELRKELTRLYRGLSEEQKSPVLAKQSIQKTVRTEKNFAGVIAALAGLSSQLEAAQASLIREYREIEKRDLLRRENEEEDDLEVILMGIL